MTDTREGDDRQRFVDRCFEFLKHVATLSTAAALLILAIYREAPLKGRLLVATLILIGLSVVISVFGMQVIAIGSRTPPPNQTVLSEKAEDAMIGWITISAGHMFSGSVVAFALAILAVPFWTSVSILLALLVLVVGALLFVRWRRKRQSSTNKSPDPEQDGERSP